MLGKIFARPQRNPSSIIYCIYGNHRIRICEGYGGWRSGLPQRVEERVIEKALGIR